MEEVVQYNAVLFMVGTVVFMLILLGLISLGAKWRHRSRSVGMQIIGWIVMILAGLVLGLIMSVLVLVQSDLNAAASLSIGLGTAILLLSLTVYIVNDRRT